MKSPIFVLSTGRCGTLALQKFLNRSREFEVFHRYRGRRAAYRNDMSFVLEQNYVYYHVIKNPECPSHLRENAVQRLRKSRQPLIDKLCKEERGFIEINHEFSPFSELLLEAFPEAKFIHLVRHPASVVSSFMSKFDPLLMSLPAFMGTRYSLQGQYVLRYKHVKNVSRFLPGFLKNAIESHQFDNHLHPFEFTDGAWRENMEMNPFEKTCWYWNEINRIILDFFDSLPDGERKLRVSFENLFASEMDKDKEALLHFSASKELSVTDMQEFVTQKLNFKKVRSEFPSYTDWGEEMVHTLLHYCHETMERLGYK